MIQIIDQEIRDLISKETKRQNTSLGLIASENFVSPEVLLAQGSTLTNKYAEGYPGKRYYGGCSFVDDVESIAIQRVKKLFNCEYANVQPHSGSTANQAVLLSLLTPGDTVLAMGLDSGGHLTHGSKVNLSGKWFNFVHYSVDPKTYLIDYNEIEELAEIHKPKLIIAGYSAYTRALDFIKFQDIARKVGAFSMADIAHIAGLVATNHHQTPLPYADVVTSTTHKTLRGARGGIILSNNGDIFKKMNTAVFPGIQGGPLMHSIAAKAVSFKEALQPEFTKYIKQVLDNAKVLANTLSKRNYSILTGSTDNHMIIVSLTSKNIYGNIAEEYLDKTNIICNKQVIPFDSQKATVTSGIRLGTPACTTRGMKETEFIKIANLIADVLDEVSINGKIAPGIVSFIQKESIRLTSNFPLKY